MCRNERLLTSCLCILSRKGPLDSLSGVKKMSEINGHTIKPESKLIINLLCMFYRIRKWERNPAKLNAKT